VKNSFKFTKYFIAEPKPESLEESKLGIHYTIKFHDIYKEGRKLGEVFSSFFMIKLKLLL